MRTHSNDRLKGTLDLLVLKTLASQGKMHGYAITLRIEQISENVLRLEEGSLYPALHRMTQAGWLSSEWGVSESNRRARTTRSPQPGAGSWRRRLRSGPS
jgi:PadR family transcriptional regulator, regulatory protein PadR